MTERLTVTVPPGEGSRRADRVVADAAGLSRSYVQRLISEGRLTMDGQPVKSNTLLAPGTNVELEVPPPADTSLAAEQVALAVLYEDEDVLVIDKPAGMTTHPAPGQRDGTLVNALLGMADASSYGQVAGPERPGIVHRLDRDTSGLLLVARNDRAQQALMDQLRARRVKKTYLALVHGSPPAEVGRIEAPIGRDPHRPTRMSVVATGRPSTTGYRARERFDGWTLLELDLVTGRTHQLRVHLASIGHPIAGDPLYASGPARPGPVDLGRMFLHSWRLEFISPAAERLVRVEAALPLDLDQVLVRLREEGPR
ncbi:MAG TPA: RluA family pseudouridine synthase [Candidatus Limnocylindrales bacterium]|nr:RluA family pseudouridine synthase [Candidatus Limnocylindrales bacterium]